MEKNTERLVREYRRQMEAAIKGQDWSGLSRVRDWTWGACQSLRTLDEEGSWALQDLLNEMDEVLGD